MAQKNAKSFNTVGGLAIVVDENRAQIVHESSGKLIHRSSLDKVEAQRENLLTLLDWTLSAEELKEIAKEKFTYNNIDCTVLQIFNYANFNAPYNIKTLSDYSHLPLEQQEFLIGLQNDKLELLMAYIFAPIESIEA